MSVACFALASAFVGSLYLAPAHVRVLGHDDPRQIRQRGVALSAVCALSLIYVMVTCSDVVPLGTRLGMVGLRVAGLVPAAVLPMVLTGTLFLGPMVCSACENVAYQRLRHNVRHMVRGGRTAATAATAAAAPSPPPTPTPAFRFQWPTLGRMLENVRGGLYDPSTLRTLVVAPITEELVFRGCMSAIMMRAGHSPGYLIFTLPLFFGVAHAHHLYRLIVQEERRVLRAVLICLFQFMYTTLFGIYATFVLLRSGHLVAAIICHMFCNYMGFPDFGWLTDADSVVRKDRTLIGASFCVGIAGFYWGLFRLTRPAIYDVRSTGFWHNFLREEV
jgi:prenyl protein peptidase